jgi:hypothetical protein
MGRAAWHLVTSSSERLPEVVFDNNDKPCGSTIAARYMAGNPRARSGCMKQFSTAVDRVYRSREVAIMGFYNRLASKGFAQAAFLAELAVRTLQDVPVDLTVRDADKYLGSGMQERLPTRCGLKWTQVVAARAWLLVCLMRGWGVGENGEVGSGKGACGVPRGSGKRF